MTAVRTLFADRTATRIDGEHGTWLLAGVATNRLHALVDDATGVRDVTDEIEDGVAVFASRTDGGGRVEAFRSATSSRDLFYLEASDGSVVLADHFRNAVSQLDAADRTVPRRALVDHLLFRSPVEPLTYVEEVGRLGRGECLEWRGDDREWTRSVVDSLGTDERLAPSEAVDALDDALRDVVDATIDPDARTMLSGGVDSTLLATYVDEPSGVQVTFDSPEFQLETNAGRDAADALDADRETVSLSESAFREHLEDCVDALGLPPRYNQTVFTAAAFRLLPDGQYVNGQCSDALFGLPGVKAARVADWLSPLLDSDAVARAASAAPGRVNDLYDVLAHRHRQLRRPVSSPESFAQALSVDADPDTVASVFDADAVRERAQRRTEYATNRAAPDADEGFARQVGVGHLVDFLTDDAVNQWRQLGYADGQDLVVPFRTRRVAECALAVPPERRYVKGLSDAPKLATKHVPKSLLSRRLPEYDVHREKGAGSLPIERYVTDGPLADVFDRYDPPAFLTPETREQHAASYGSLTWPLLTYSVWRDRVLLNDGVDLVPGTETEYLRLPQEPPSPTW